MAEHGKARVKVVLHESVHTRVDDTDYGPGDTVEVPSEHADGLIENGFAHREADSDKWQADQAKADEADAKAQADAQQAADEAEAIKVRSAEETRASYNEPVPVRRGRPAKG